jgi:hypothetical protein
MDILIRTDYRRALNEVVSKYSVLVGIHLQEFMSVDQMVVAIELRQRKMH